MGHNYLPLYNYLFSLKKILSPLVSPEGRAILVTMSKVKPRKYYSHIQFSGLQTLYINEVVMKKLRRPIRKHLKYRIQEDGWARYDDWSLGPEQPLDDWEKKNYNESKKLRLRLAHHCPDGSIRSPGPLYINPKGRTGVVVSARCVKCKAKLCQKIKFLLQLHLAPLGNV